jgi:hypothetical protein
LLKPDINVFPDPYPTPVLIITFNRLDCVKALFKRLKLVKPPILYVFSDGPRETLVNESEIIREIRSHILDVVDWECEIKTLFNDENEGCKLGVTSAINWFFENEEMGIILEDDCIPNDSFFQFCAELLEKYRYDENVLHIGGTNPLGVTSTHEDYYFSKFNRIWGWASWRRAWNHYDVNITFWPEIKAANMLNDFFDLKTVKYYTNILDEVYKGNINTWDYQWFLCRLLHGVAIIPSKNLISNIGFNQNATHTTSANSAFSKLLTHELTFPLIHPKSLKCNEVLDLQWEKEILKESLFKKILKKIKNLIK